MEPDEPTQPSSSMPVGLPPLDAAELGPILRRASAQGGPYNPVGWWGLPSRLLDVLHGRGFLLGAAQCRLQHWRQRWTAQLVRFRRVLLGRGFLIGVAQSQALRGAGVAGSDGEAWKRVLDVALGAASDPAAPETGLDEPGDEVWQRVLDVDSGRHWWWLPGTSRSFWEGDPAWQKFRDPETSQLRWWLHAESNTWFWVVGYSGLPPTPRGRQLLQEWLLQQEQQQPPALQWSRRE